MAKHATTDQPLVAPGADETTDSELEDLWSRHSAAWRQTAQIASQWQEADLVDPALLRFKAHGNWWQVLADLGITLLIGREYEHLLIAMTVNEGPHVTYMPLPHPSGIAVDRKNSVVYVASTRNPNQVYDLVPTDGCLDRLDVENFVPEGKPLLPVRSRFLPGCLYMHDLAIVNGSLHANAVGHNAVVRLHQNGNYERVWWPRCIETEHGPHFGQNHIQLNSIAAGKTLADCFFSASSARLSARRPGHKNYPVDGRGVIFCGRTREPIVGGLTRPHSARLHEGRIWVDNSGYGEVGLVEDGRFQSVTKLPGWTRGLAFYRGIALVGTSRVIPRFSQYAPGLDVNTSICAVHAIEVKSGKLLGSLQWPSGNQIFAIEWLPRSETWGFPFSVERTRDTRPLFYSFSTVMQKEI